MSGSVAEVCTAHIDANCKTCDEHDDDLWIHPRDLGACRQCGNRYVRENSFYGDASICPGCGDEQSDEDDYTPAPRNYEKCGDCGEVLELRHHCQLQARLAAAGRQLAAIRELCETWRYKGEFGWGPWQTGDGPDQEGWILDKAAAELLAILDSAGGSEQGSSE